MSVGRLLQQAAAGAGAEPASDDDFANVVLLLDGDGTSGDDNNTFTDSGSVGATITENGDVIQGSFSPYGDNWSVYFDGSSYLDTASGATALGTGAFTVEFWINTTDTSFNIMNPDSSSGNGFWGLLVQSGDLRWNNQYALTNLWIVDGAPILDGQWHHVAIVSSSSVFKVFYDGVSQSLQSGSFNDSFNYPYNDGLRIGSGNLGTFKGYLSNIRLVSGTAIYSSDFDIPTAPFTNSTSYTEKLLACQSNRFIDNGNSEYAITTSGHPKVTPFSPFKDDDARDITTDGGSAYFAGSGDHVDITDNNDLDFGTGDFTVEFWAYIDKGTNNQDGIISKGNTGTGWQIIFADTDRLKFIRTSGNASNPQITSSTSSVVEYQWHHIALTRSGTTVTLWINGVSEGTYSDSTSWDTGQPLRIATNRGENNDYVGYISDVRVFKGVAIYTAAFDPPTEPLGNVTGTAGTLDYVEYENKSFSVSSQESNPQGVRFKLDGTKMYVVGNTGDDVMQYSLSTAWDVSTASFDSVTFSVASQDTIPNGIAFSSDGAEMYISGNNTDKVYQYDLSTPWDLSTASYANKSLSTQGTNPIEPFMRSNGTDFYCLDNNADTVYQYTLSTANDISTASYASKSFSVASQETTPTGLAFSSDGTKMFVCGQVGDDVNQYTLSTAWDISTASFDNKAFSFKGQTTNPSGIDLKPDDTKLYMISNTGDAVYQYDLTVSKQPEVLLNFQDAGIYDRSGINNLDTVSTAQIDTAVKKYGTGSIEFSGNTTDKLVASSPDLVLGTGDFTIEFWVYFDSINDGNVYTLLDGRTSSDTTALVIAQESSGAWTSRLGDSTLVDEGWTSSTFTTGTWYHIAITRESGTTRYFKDGTKTSADLSDTGNYDSDTYNIGGRYAASGKSINGYIDDFRITKGIARYTADFTPPTAEHPKF